MFNISSFLKKATDTIDASELKKREVLIAVKKYTNIAIEMKNLDIKNDTAHLKVSPLIKNVVFIKKEPILADLDIFGITDIR